MPKSLISIHDLSKEEILHILHTASAFEREPDSSLLRHKVIATLFFEPSTRTRLSFETAANRLSARIIGFTDSGSTSVTKGESIKDTIKTVSNYADLIVIRHPLEGSARYASEVSSVPVINAGDGANQHPSQTLLDMYSILKTQQSLDGLQLTLVGDLKYGRTVHSLLQAMSLFSTRFTFVSPPELAMPLEYKQFLQHRNLSYKESKDLLPHIPEADILYITRVQAERFSEPMEYEKVKNVYSLTASMLHPCKPNLKILHPLPRVNEIALDVDNTPQAYYFEQARNGIYTRMAIMAYLLGLT
ncbi:MAG: aspartate carbamoyltransferase [Bacteroidales bacterium]|nr:aspartate carbamoyltransferase [Bacteroidales bacterium]